MMKTIHTLFYLGFIFLLLACDNEEDPVAPPSAGFTFASNELEVSFTNTSTDAMSYSWDFGDNTTSTETNPVHTYAEAGTYQVTLTASNNDVTDEVAQSVEVSLNPENVRVTSGFIVTGFTEDNSVLARYFEELPSGTIDLTQGQAFQQFFPWDVYDGAVYIQRSVGNGFSKVAVNGNGEIVEDGTIPTTGENAFTLRIRDSETGIFIDPNDFTQVKVFNPQTLQEIGNIDLSAAPLFEERPEAAVSSAVIRGDDVFISYAQGSNPNLLDNFTMIRGSISGGTLGNQLNSTTGPTFTFNPLHRLSDEDGNLYIHHTGNLNPVPAANLPGILKIPAGSNEFDPNYDFRVVGNSTLLLHSMRAFQYYQNGLAYAHVGVETPQAVVDILISVGGDISNLSQEQINQILALLNTSENARWVELDLNAQTLRVLPGLPGLNPFATTNAYFIDNVPHFPIVNTTENAVYKYDPATDQSEKVFDVTGASISTIIDLSANNLK
ncbi:MAG: PKD domain-containing protein [Bacteroidota bacterium]